MISIVVNGEPTSVQSGCSLAELVSNISSTDRGVAVAINAAVAPKSAWSTTGLSEGDQVEILTAAPGG